MPRRRKKWSVTLDATAVRYAFFISHVQEDADDVTELKNEIHAVSGRGGRPPLLCFLDRHNWPGGNENTTVIREYLLKSQHALFWVTPEYLRTIRGWVWIELAYAELIEVNLNSNNFDHPLPYIVSVFRNTPADQIERTPLIDYWSRKLVRPDEDLSIKEIARRLVDFHEQESQKRI
jgi:hypothetical protein